MSKLVQITRGTATLPPDIEEQFVRAQGREMTAEERKFFGLTQHRQKMRTRLFGAEAWLQGGLNVLAYRQKQFEEPFERRQPSTSCAFVTDRPCLGLKRFVLWA